MNEASEISVRPAQPADGDIVADFNIRLAWETESLALDSATIRAGVEALLNDAGKGRYFVAEANGRVIGQTCVTYEWSDWRNGQIWWLQSVYVDAAWRKMGVFGRLLEHVRIAARESGVVALRLYVERENHVAQAAYTRRGWSMTHYLVMESASVSPGLADAPAEGVLSAAAEGGFHNSCEAGRP